MRTLIFLYFTMLLTAQNVFAQIASDINKYRTELIVKAFNSKSESLISPISNEQVHLGVRDGRVDVNPKTKFSYFIQISEMSNINSDMILIPMATSRYTPTYYQTDDWWDAHKDEIAKAKANGTAMPKQDMNEVIQWLEDMKLSTNPDVIRIKGKSGQIERQPLQDFLLDHYLKYYAHDGYITLYRGAEKAGEIDSWKNGKVPRGARYWTPNATYAWRYGRKNLNFLDELLKNETPLFKFKIPVNDFKSMVQRKWQRLTLGTELTKNAHQSFDRNNEFIDHLTGLPYPGEGTYGVEFELRSNKAGAQDMIHYFKGPVTIDDLANDRLTVLTKTFKRLIQQNPENESQLKHALDSRIKQIYLEKEIINQIKTKNKSIHFDELLNTIDPHRSEIVDIDGLNFKDWAFKNSLFKMSCKGLF